VPDVGRQFSPDKRGGRAYGSNNLESLFPDGANTTTLPHDHFNKKRGYDREAVKTMLQSPPADRDMVDVDPRTLKVSQPAVTRSGVKYYSGNEYENTGKTFAEPDNVGNARPVVYSRNDGSEDILLSGHHRMMAKLLQGKPLKVRRVSGP
jgi:hypothetical protein